MSDLFNPTSWTKIRRAAHGGGEEQETALNALAESYRQPLLHLARCVGIPANDTEDAVQEVMATVLSPAVLGRLDRSRGRFSDYLASVLRNRWRQWVRADRRACRDSRLTEPLGPESEACPAGQDEWVAVIDARHAVQCLERTRLVLAAEASVPEEFEALWDGIFHLGDQAHAARAAELGISPNAYSQRLRGMRRRFRQKFMDEVKAGVTDPADLSAECVHLLKLALQQAIPTGLA